MKATAHTECTSCILENQCTDAGKVLPIDCDEFVFDNSLLLENDISDQCNFAE